MLAFALEMDLLVLMLLGARFKKKMNKNGNLMENEQNSGKTDKFWGVYQHLGVTLYITIQPRCLSLYPILPTLQFCLPYILDSDILDGDPVPEKGSNFFNRFSCLILSNHWFKK